MAANKEAFDFGPVPPLPRPSVSATYEELTSHPELYYQGADIGFMIVAAALVFFMIPGLCLHYSGVSKFGSTLTLVRLPLITTAVVGCVWYLWGYTLAFSPATPVGPPQRVSWYGSDSRANAYIDVLARPVGIQGPDPTVLTGPKIPEMVYVFYQGMFACFTASLVSGGAAGKTRVGRFLLFITLWVTLVYCPVARWTWHPLGWSRARGAMDFAGGSAVHICSGSSVAAICVFSQLDSVGWATIIHFRRGRTIKIDFTSWKFWTWISMRRTANDNPLEMATGLPIPTQPANGQVPTPGTTTSSQIRQGNQDPDPSDFPYSINHMVIGTAMLWVGWFGFNGGSALGANLRAVSACLATQAAASSGGTVGLLIEWFLRRAEKRISSNPNKIPTPSVGEFCDGVIAGLVAITPAAGYVPVKYAPVFGVVGAVICKFLRLWSYKHLLPADHQAIFAVHAGGGATGMLLTAFFANDATTGLDGYSRLIDRTMGARFRDQALDITACLSYSFLMTFAILLLLRILELCFGAKILTAPRATLNAYPETYYEANAQYKTRRITKSV